MVELIASSQHGIGDLSSSFSLSPSRKDEHETNATKATHARLCLVTVGS